MSSSRVPPWDLLRVLHFLCGSTFEPFVSSSLCDLTRKVLFLVSLATVHRVGELQVISLLLMTISSFRISQNFAPRLGLP